LKKNNFELEYLAAPMLAAEQILADIKDLAARGIPVMFVLTQAETAASMHINYPDPSPDVELYFKRVAEPELLRIVDEAKIERSKFEYTITACSSLAKLLHIIAEPEMNRSRVWRDLLNEMNLGVEKLFGLPSNDYIGPGFLHYGDSTNQKFLLNIGRELCQVVLLKRSMIKLLHRYWLDPSRKQRIMTQYTEEKTRCENLSSEVVQCTSLKSSLEQQVKESKAIAESLQRWEDSLKSLPEKWTKIRTDIKSSYENVLLIWSYNWWRQSSKDEAWMNGYIIPLKQQCIRLLEGYLEELSKLNPILNSHAKNIECDPQVSLVDPKEETFRSDVASSIWNSCYASFEEIHKRMHDILFHEQELVETKWVIALSGANCMDLQTQMMECQELTEQLFELLKWLNHMNPSTNSRAEEAQKELFKDIHS